MIFDKRTSYKPYEYPDAIRYKDAISHAYWLVGHMQSNILADVDDYHTKLSSSERSAVRRAMLAISQIEVSVKRFWTNLGTRFPKSEFEQIGVTFGESEIRHSDAYSHLLYMLGLNDDFATLLNEPAIQGRVDYLQKYLAGASSFADEDYTLTLTLFSIFIENVSLFSQFAILQSFRKHKNLMRGIDNVVRATQQDEDIHAKFGVYLVGLIKAERPDWFGADFYAKLKHASNKAYEAECRILDWIFEDGDLPFCSKASLREFLKQRFNDSLVAIGGEPHFDVDTNVLESLRWFDEGFHGKTNIDFFHTTSVSYSRPTQSYTAEDLF